jgi:DNA-directed RNA polymerase specialized sigma24 family protein
MDARSEFALLFKEQRLRLVRLSRNLGISADVAVELVQESFVALWQKIQDGEEVESHIAFLVTTTKNKTLNFLKSSYHRQVIFKDDLEEEGGMTEDFGCERLREQCVAEKIGVFERQYPEAGYAIKMQLDGMEIARIAEAINRTSEATRQFLYQIRKKLKNYLIECKEL